MLLLVLSSSSISDLLFFLCLRLSSVFSLVLRVLLFAVGVSFGIVSFSPPVALSESFVLLLLSVVFDVSLLDVCVCAAMGPFSLQNTPYFYLSY